jgi:hypothetical protein
MSREKKLLIEFLSQNGFDKDAANVYVTSLSKHPNEPTGLRFSAILELISFALNEPKGENQEQ